VKAVVESTGNLWMLSRDEPYRDMNRGLTERKLKNMGKRAYDGLRN
jgi:hypothetical protein